MCPSLEAETERHEKNMRHYEGAGIVPRFGPKEIHWVEHA